MKQLILATVVLLTLNSVAQAANYTFTEPAQYQQVQYQQVPVQYQQVQYVPVQQVPVQYVQQQYDPYYAYDYQYGQSQQSGNTIQNAARTVNEISYGIQSVRNMISTFRNGNW